MRRSLKLPLLAAGSLAALIVLLLLVLTQTDFGRERVRMFGLGQLAERVHGRVAVGRIEGNLLSGVRLIDVAITDSAGAPFLRADTLSLRYSLRSLYRKHLTFQDVRLVDAVVVLDRQPGERWNFERLFQGDTVVSASDTIPGFGDWIRLENLELVRADVTVRSAWAPDSALAGAARAEAVRLALSPERRDLIVEVPGGWQRVVRLERVNGRLPFVRLADPDSATRVVDIARLSTVALPFRPPAAHVRNARGRIAFGADTVQFLGVHLQLPASQLRVDGWYSTRTGAINARIRSDTLAFPDLRFALPELPAGGGRMNLAVGRVGALTRVVATDLEVSAEGARVAGSLDVQTGPVVRIGASDLRYRELDTRLLERLLPALELPVDGVLSGDMRLAGVPERLDVAGWTTIRDRAGATSRIEADGIVGNAAGGVRARDLALRFDPLRLSLLRGLGVELPVGGTITGRATLNGALDARFALDADVVHADAGTGRSRVRARGELSRRDGLTAHGLRLGFDPLQVALLRRFDPGLPIDGAITGSVTLDGAPARGLAAALSLRHQGSTGVSALAGDARVTCDRGLRFIDTDLRVQPLALATAGRFAPAAGLHGTASGTIQARGDASRIAFTTNLAVANGGDIRARGVLGLDGPVRYDLTSELAGFDPAAVSTRAPAARLSGSIIAVGSGTAPATADALVDAALVDSRGPGTPELDSTRVRARIADGLARFERGHIRIASAVADIEGSFGLVSGRSGELRYRVRIDTLAQLPGLEPGDTVRVPPRPLPQARRVAQARADSAARALEIEVERAATGEPAPATLALDTLEAIRGDSVAGALRAEGVLAGNIERFTASGTAEMEDVVFRGNAVGTGRIGYQVTRVPARPLSAEVSAELREVRAGGFAFDSVRAELEHAGGLGAGEGRVDVALYQDRERDYRLNSEFTLALDRKEVRIRDLTMRFDSTVWEEVRPGRVSWAAAGVELDRIELRSARGGRIFADGRLPTEQGSGDLRLAIDSLQIADFAALLQDTLETRGLLTLDARVQGSLRAPRASGALALDSAARAGQEIPSVRSTFAYAARELTAHLEATRDTLDLLLADVVLPVDLALSGRQGPLLLRDAPIRIDAHADSLPLEALPSFTTAVQDMRGRLAGDVVVRGTAADPALTGQVDLTLGSLRIAEPGILLTDGVATLRLEGQQAFVDSLVARSGSGTLRLTGALDVAELTRPGFDLVLVADDALVLDDERGRVRADAELAIAGPFDSLRITGDIAVQRGVIYVPDPTKIRRASNLDDPTMVSVLDTLQVAPELRRLPPPILRNLQADIGIRVARDTWVRSPTANVEVYTPDDAGPVRLRIDNARQAIVLEGTINADRGEYSLAGRPFALTTGSITFLGNPDPDPLLQLSAQYHVARRNREALIILINVGGYLSEPRITLSSNAQPPLPESDLISYLAFGRSSSSLVDQGGSGLTGGELGFLAQQQLTGLGLGAFVDASVSGLEAQGTRAGLDVFRVRPAPMPDELNFGGYFQTMLQGMEVEAGKYLTPRLFLSAQGRTSGTLPGLRLEWQRADGFSWDASWESSYLPQQPSLADVQATRTRVLGTFLRWNRRF